MDFCLTSVITADDKSKIRIMLLYSKVRYFGVVDGLGNLYFITVRRYVKGTYIIYIVSCLYLFVALGYCLPVV